MAIRLCIGLQHLDADWQSVLNQMGVWYEQVDYSVALTEQYSVIILNSKPDQHQKKKLVQYLANGGSVIETGNIGSFFPPDNITSKRASTLLNESKYPAFQHLPFIDIDGKIYSHTDSSIFDGLIHFTSYKDGFIGFFGLDLPQYLNRSDYQRKRFFNPTGKYPDEIVSKVSKNELAQSFEALLKEMHFLRNLPFVKKWGSPSEKPVFCFRIDSDYGDKPAMQNLYYLAKKYDISCTWFLHVAAHEQWLSLFKTFENQKIALHGYAHGTSNSVKKITQNIESGLKLLKDAGFQPQGFCAPYGIWNKALSESLKKYEFKYSSEFTFSYDGFPIQPAGQTLPLQIPIHPICTGSLNRQLLSNSEMCSYFDFVLANKLARFEPILFYHHPMQTGLEAIAHVFERVNAEKTENLTFGEFAEFWQQRANCTFNAFWDGNKLTLEAVNDNEILFQVSENHQSFDLIRSETKKKKHSLSPKFEFAKQYLPEPNQVLEMRKRDLKLIKTSILDWKNRVHL